MYKRQVLLVFITSFFVSQLFCYYMPSNWLYFLVKLPIIFSICLGAIFYVGCTKMERLYLIERLSLIKNKIMEISTIENLPQQSDNFLSYL